LAQGKNPFKLRTLTKKKELHGIIPEPPLREAVLRLGRGLG